MHTAKIQQLKSKGRAATGGSFARVAPSEWKEIPYHRAAVKTDPPTVTWEVNAVGNAVRSAIGNAVGSALNVLKALNALNALNAPPVTVTVLRHRRKAGIFFIIPRVQVWTLPSRSILFGNEKVSWFQK